MKVFDINVRSLTVIRTKKITFAGETKEHNVYRVPINQLYYNNLNGRIATYISQYEADGKRISDLDNEEYNDTIAEYIKNSATAARYKRTKDDIRISGQKEVGTILTDGRVIDGNRRFTCLRELFKETGDSKYEYFEAVVIPVPEKNDEHAWKAIRSLELETQYGTDEKVDYDPIDWLASVYRDLVKDQIYTEEEYKRILKISSSDYKKLKAKAEIMGDFLTFFNKEEQFYVAKRLELDGPISELVSIYRKSDKREWNRIKVVFYVFMWTKRTGDKSRELRRIVRMYGTPEFEGLIDSARNDAERILHPENYSDSEPNGREGKSNRDIANSGSSQGDSSFLEKAKEASNKHGQEEAKMKPIKCCNDAIKSLNGIDITLVRMWKEEKLREEFYQLIDDIIRLASRMKK